jgi:hypothetical protein
VVLVAKQLVTNQALLQNEDPSADNYVSIRCSNPEATYRSIRVPLSGMHGGYFGTPLQMPSFQLEGTSLEPGDTFTVTYGDTSGGSRGFKVQTWSTDRLKLPLYLDLDGSGTFLTPVWPGLELVGGEVAAVRAVAPSVVAAGERFELAVRSEDRYTNRATGAIPAYEVLVNGEPFGHIPAGDDAISVLENRGIEGLGIYRFTVRSEDGSIAGTSNPVWVRQDPPFRVYWGETHVHTDFAEGQGSPERGFRYARDDARLDFLTLSEHDIWMDDLEWKTLQGLAERYTDEGRFVAFLGYEWTLSSPRGGHHNVLFRTPDRQRVESQRANRLGELYRTLVLESAPADTLIIPHAHQPGDWTQNDPELERLVEMYSMHGTFEWFGNFYLRNGFEIGFIAASDDHRARPGYAHGLTRPPLAQLGGLAAVLAPEKTADAIFDAMRDLGAYATSGQRIILDANLNGSRSGSRQGFTEERNISCRVMGTAPIDHIDVIKNGDVVFSRHYLTAPLDPHTWVLVGFETSSETGGAASDPPPGSPRQYRIWEGTLKVEGAQVASVSAPGFENAYMERAGRDPDDPGLIRFLTATRGRTDTLLVELEGTSPSTELTLHLEPTTQISVSAPDLRIVLSDLADGPASRELTAEEPFSDRVTLQLIDPTGAADQEFSYTDLGPFERGDYYYVRVTQLDGGRAWSSPFWVGRKEE